MNEHDKLVMAIGFLKGLINGHDYYTTVSVEDINKFIKEIAEK